MNNSLIKHVFKSKILLLFTAISIVLYSLLNIMLAYILKYLLDLASTRDFTNFNIAIVFIVIYIVALFITSYTRSIMQAKLVEKTMVNLKEDIFNKIIDKNIEDFNSEKNAQYLSVLTNDLHIIESDYYNNIIGMIDCTFSFIVASILLIKLNWIITLGVFLTTIITILVPQIVNKKIQKLKLNYSENLSRFTSKIKDIFGGYEIIKCFNISNKISNTYREINTEVEASKKKLSITTGLATSLSHTLAMCMFFSALSIGTYLAIMGTITIGTMIAATQLMNNIANPIVEISNGLNVLKSVKLLKYKIIDIIQPKTANKHNIHKNNFENDIKLNDISFCYLDNKYALKNISLTIEKGKKYVLVGTSGSGKSTLVKLLTNYYQNYQGEILIDGINNKDIDTEDLYNLISVIHQNVFIFDGSIKDNITLYNNYNDYQIEDAIKIAGLESTINSLDNHLDNLVGENGLNLSGGEKQRLSIARAVIRKSPIIILDEATAALDPETSYNIEDSILNLKDTTIIVITHKLNKELLRRYDCIIALKDGDIVEMGSFESLINKNSYFYSLYNIQ